MSHQIKVSLSSLERNEIAALLPELSDSMKLGSTNSRVIPLSVEQSQAILHAIKVDKRYGDPELLDDGFADDSFIDSTCIKLDEVVPKSGKLLKFEYEYDFGDGWKHEIAFEGCLKSEKGMRYPICLEGENACPPEDVGGVYGYADYLEAIADPNHEQHEDMIQWGGDFDPKHFDAQKTTNKMRRGLPNWRRMG